MRRTNIFHIAYRNPRGTALTLCALALATLATWIDANWVFGKGNVWTTLCCSLAAICAILATLLHRRFGTFGRPYRVADQVESSVMLVAAGYAIGSSGSALSLFWVALFALAELRARLDFDARATLAFFASLTLALCGYFWRQAQPADAWWSLICGTALFAIYLPQRAARREAEHLADERQRLQASIEELSVKNERDRIARELHDGVGAELYALIWAAQTLGDSGGEGAAQAGALVARIQRSISELRGVVNVLRDGFTPWRKLVSQLKERIADLKSDVTISVHIEENGDDDVPSDIEQQILRTVQESVTNALRHASPTRVDVRLRNGSGWSVEIIDDGKGFDPKAPGRRSGLANMQARAATLGGKFTIDSSERGTRISAHFPAQRASNQGNKETLLR